MKSLLIIAASALGIGLGIMIYRRRNANKQNEPKLQPQFIPKKHHLTNAFASAKKHALHQ